MTVGNLKRILSDDDGATAVEYGIMVAAIAAVIITIVISVGTKTNSAFKKVHDELAASGLKSIRLST